MPGVAFSNAREAREAAFLQVALGLGHLFGNELGSNDLSFCAVVSDGGGEIDGGQAVRGSEFHDGFRADGAGQEIQECALFAVDGDHLVLQKIWPPIAILQVRRARGHLRFLHVGNRMQTA